MTKESPESVLQLIHILQLPQFPRVPKYTDVRNGKIAGVEYQKLRDLKYKMTQERKAALKPYQVGTHKEYEGSGYFVKPLYLYNEKYYA